MLTWLIISALLIACDQLLLTWFTTSYVNVFTCSIYFPGQVYSNQFRHFGLYCRRQHWNMYLFYFLIVWSVKYHRCRVSCVKRRCVFFVYVKKSQHRCQCLLMFHASLRHCKAFVAHYDIFEIKYEQSLRIWKSTVMSLICFSGIFFENFISSLLFSCPPTHTHCLNGARVYFYNLHSALLLCSKAFDFIFFCAKLLSKVLDFRNHFLP